MWGYFWPTVFNKHILRCQWFRIWPPCSCWVQRRVLLMFWDLQRLYDYNHLRYIQVGLNFRIHPCLKCDICLHSIMLIEKTSKSVEEKLSVGSGLFAKQARPQDWALEQCSTFVLKLPPHLSQIRGLVLGRVTTVVWTVRCICPVFPMQVFSK